MQLDDLKAAWAAHGVMLERSLVINERLLRETMLGKVRARLAPYLAWRVVELVLGIVAAVMVGSVVAAHAAEVRYLVVGGAVLAFAVAITAMTAALVVRGVQLEYDRPVTTIRGAIERMTALEYRATKWAVLGGVLLWLPALLVVFEAVTGVAALARVDLAYLVANLALGVGVLAVGHGLSRRYVERTDLGPRARRFVDAMTGRGLRAARAQLAELATFEREESPAR